MHPRDELDVSAGTGRISGPTIGKRANFAGI